MPTKVLLLGAGASVPFFKSRLTTTLLTNAIQDETRWRELVRRYSELMGNTNMLDVDVVMDVITRIIRISPSSNFEQIIELVDKISSFNFDPLPESKVLHSLLHYFRAVPDSRIVWDCVPFLFRQLICEVVVTLSDEPVSNYAHLTSLQRDFIKKITAEGGLNIFSLNYDEIIYDSTEQLDFTNGFLNGRFQVNTYARSMNVLSFPHGHVRFSEDNHGVLYFTQGGIANFERLSRIARNDLLGTKYLNESPYSFSFNTFIVTGQMKDSTFDRNPYSIYYQRFASDVLRAATIYVVGYSFSDPHLNRMLLNFKNLHALNRICIIDFLSPSIDMKEEFQDSTSLIKRILTTFDTRSIDLTPQVEYIHRDAIDDVNKNGYGYIIPQIWFYKKGYDSFLKEFHVLP